MIVVKDGYSAGGVSQGLLGGNEDVLHFPGTGGGAGRLVVEGDFDGLADVCREVDIPRRNEGPRIVLGLAGNGQRGPCRAAVGRDFASRALDAIVEAAEELAGLVESEDCSAHTAEVDFRRNQACLGGMIATADECRSLHAGVTVVEVPDV